MVTGAAATCGQIEGWKIQVLKAWSRNRSRLARTCSCSHVRIQTRGAALILRFGGVKLPEKKKRKKKERTYSSVELTEAEAVRGERPQTRERYSNPFTVSERPGRHTIGFWECQTDCGLFPCHIVRNLLQSTRFSVSGHVISGPVWNPIPNVPMSATQKKAQRTNQR